MTKRESESRLIDFQKKMNWKQFENKTMTIEQDE